MKVLSDPVTVNEEQSGGKPLHKNVRRCSFVKIHKPGDLLKESKLLPMKARLHTQRNDILLHTEYESKIYVLPYIRKRVPVAEDVGEVCFQEKEADFFAYDEPSADLCLHEELNLANVHHRAVKRQKIRTSGGRVGL